MKTLACVFCYERPKVLNVCAWSLLGYGDRLLDEVRFIDDGSGPEVQAVLDKVQHAFPNATFDRKPHLGFSDSARRAFAYARTVNPKFALFVEGDHIYRQNSIDVVLDVFEHTEQGRHCLGIAGYDHPAYHFPDVRDSFVNGMVAQMGCDNVNRAALWKPVKVSGARYEVEIELVSNTCFTFYLNWRLIQEVAAEFPELNDLLDQAAAPRDNPNYPASGEYRARGLVDDGMLSHAINLVWNRWALKHGIDRDKFAGWLNIRPSVAQHVAGGGLNNTGDEMETNAGSPTW
jgi:hypothetical protein